MFNKLIKKEEEKAREEIETRHKYLKLLGELRFAKTDVVCIAHLTTEAYLEGHRGYRGELESSFYEDMHLRELYLRLQEYFVRCHRLSSYFDLCIDHNNHYTRECLMIDCGGDVKLTSVRCNEMQPLLSRTPTERLLEAYVALQQSYPILFPPEDTKKFLAEFKGLIIATFTEEDP